MSRELVLARTRELMMEKEALDFMGGARRIAGGLGQKLRGGIQRGIVKPMVERRMAKDMGKSVAALRQSREDLIRTKGRGELLDKLRARAADPRGYREAKIRAKGRGDLLDKIRTQNAYKPPKWGKRLAVGAGLMSVGSMIGGMGAGRQAQLAQPMAPPQQIPPGY